MSQSLTNSKQVCCVCCHSKYFKKNVVSISWKEGFKAPQVLEKRFQGVYFIAVAYLKHLCTLFADYANL